MSRVREIWEAGAHLYDEIYAGNLPYHRSHAVIVELLPKKGPVRVLDLGAGTGLLAEGILNEVPGSSVTCLDFSPGMIEQCRGRLAAFEGRAELVCADLLAWDAPGEYDAVVSCNALVYQGMDLQECYRKYAGALRSGGVFINSTVVKRDDLSLLVAAAERARAPEAPSPSEAVVEFAATTGREIAHFGEGSLAFAETMERHLALMAEAGLRAFCPWHYLAQAVVMGVKEG